MAHDVFISHSATDKAVSEAVCSTLEDNGIQCWIAPRDVRPGLSFPGEITRAIQESKVMVLIVSGASNRSQQVLREVQLAVESNLHILQLRIEDLALSDDLKYFLGTPHWLEAFAPPFEPHLERVLAATSELLGRPAFPSPGPTETVPAPVLPQAIAEAQPETMVEPPPVRGPAVLTCSKPSAIPDLLIFGLVGLLFATGLVLAAWYGLRTWQAGKIPRDTSGPADASQLTSQQSPISPSSDPESDYDRGLQYFRGGNSVSIDWKKALTYFVRAANQEFPEAEAATACLIQGNKLLYDFGEALPAISAEEWAARAWKHGLETRAATSDRAAYAVAELYSIGLGVTRDPAKASEWYERAAARGNTDAKRALGFAYWIGSGVSKDLAKAKSNLEEAVAADNASAKILLALLYLGGGDKADEPKAIELFKSAVAQGSPSAEEQMADEYETGKHVAIDLSESLRLRRKAAASGLLRAMNELGLMYENGNGTPKDLAEAARWYEKAAKVGDLKAKKALDRVRAQMASPSKTF